MGRRRYKSKKKFIKAVTLDTLDELDDSTANRTYLVELSLEDRIRVKMCNSPKGRKTKAKTVSRFSVGYEVNVENNWYTVTRYCNFHDDDTKTFHVHRAKKINPPAFDRIIKYNRKKTPASQLNWSLSNLKRNYKIYKRDFLRKFFNLND